MVERALKGEEGWQQRAGEDVESEEMGKEEDMGFRIKNGIDHRNTMSKETPINMQTVREQGKEGDESAKSAYSSHSNEGDKEKYCCNLDGCSAKFVRRGNFENHTKKVHGISISDKLREHKSVASCAVLADQKQPYQSSLPSPHQSENFGNMSMEGESAQTYHKKPKKESPRKMTCEECGMTMHKSSLKTHMTAHHTGNQDRPYRCDAPNCGARYTKCSLLKRHMKLSHRGSGRGVKKIKSLKLNHCCKFEGCDATFATRVYLRRHIQMFHDGKEEGDI